MSEPVSTVLCPQCGYDLRAIEQSAHCPECGWKIDRTGLSACQIPWSFRGESLGRWRAYVRTLGLGMWGMKRLAEEMARPVSLRDAKRFAAITALAASLPYVVLVLGAILSEGGTAFLAPRDLRLPPPSSSNPSVVPPAADLKMPYVAGMTRWPVLPLAIVMFAWLCTRVPAWFVRGGGGGKHPPPLRRERAEALGYYTSAALALALLAVGCFLAALATTYFQSPRSNGDELLLYLTFGSGGALLLLCFGLWWFNTLRLMRRMQRPSASRLIWTAIGLPAGWYACGIVAFVVLPWVAGYLCLIVESVLW